MEWLLMLLRLLLGRRRPEDSEPQPVAIRPDGTTVPLPPGSSNLVRGNYLREWLTLFSPFVSSFCDQLFDGCMPGSRRNKARSASPRRPTRRDGGTD
jgi:hypothetical protein